MENHKRISYFLAHKNVDIKGRSIYCAICSVILFVTKDAAIKSYLFKGLHFGCLSECGTSEEDCLNRALLINDLILYEVSAVFPEYDPTRTRMDTYVGITILDQERMDGDA